MRRFGALMGLNSLDADMKLWPTANWGTIAYVINIYNPKTFINC